ncbi:MAG: hypothetical protein Q7O66_00825 [Dehalococcoidia bacterium]|nr:hypothetical protein [Dehalococcoidia bacterium]
MGTVHFKPKTSEETRANLAKAAATKAANSAARQVSSLRKDFLDADHWLTLASERGLTLPPWGKPATVSNMRTWLNKVHWTQAQCEEWAGCSLRQLIESFGGRTTGQPALLLESS